MSRYKNIVLETLFICILGLHSTIVYPQKTSTKDTLHLAFKSAIYQIDAHYCDSGSYYLVKKNDSLLFRSEYGDGYSDTIIEIPFPKKQKGFIIRDLYCDGYSYSLLFIDTNTSISSRNLVELYAGNECDLMKVEELIMNDDDNDGYIELYFFFELRNKKLFKNNCSKKIDLRDFLITPANIKKRSN